MNHEIRYEYKLLLEVQTHMRLHQCDKLYDRGHKIMALIFLFSFPSMRIVNMAGAGDRPNPLLRNSSPFGVCQLTSFVDSVPIVSFPSGIVGCPIPPEASPSPSVHDCHLELCQ